MQLDEDRVGVESWHRGEGAGSLGRVGGGHRADLRLLPFSFFINDLDEQVQDFS